MKQFEFGLYKTSPYKKLSRERVVVEAATLDEARLEAKKLMRTTWRLARYGARVSDSSFTVDGAKLTVARIEAQLSMEELTERAGIGNKSSISRWERGLAHPSETAILKLAVVLGRVDFIKERNGGHDGK